MQSPLKHKLKIYIGRIEIYFFEIFTKSIKIHLKCLLKTEKSSFDIELLLDIFNIYFVYSPLCINQKYTSNRLRFSFPSNIFQVHEKSTLKVCLKQIYTLNIQSVLMYKLKIWIGRIYIYFFEIFINTMKIHVKCVLKSEKSSFEKKSSWMYLIYTAYTVN